MLEGDIEIDESLFGHEPDPNRRRVQRQIWVIGMANRWTKVAMLFPVSVRDRHTLIRENIEEGSIIYTDAWRGYLGLSQ